MSLKIEDFQSWYFAHKVENADTYAELFIGVPNQPIMGDQGIHMYVHEPNTNKSYMHTYFALEELDDFITALQYARKVATENE